MIKEYEERINHPLMEYYRTTYKDSKRWDDNDFTGKKIIIYCEQGFGDQIMFLRFLRLLKERGGTPILHAPKQLHRLIENMGYSYFDKDCPDLPDHDFHILSLSLPMVLKSHIPIEPYVIVEENYDEFVDKNKINIGITWEGNAQHESNRFRSCPFKYFLPLFKEDTAIWMASPANDDPTGEYPFWEGVDQVEMNSIQHTDFYESAKLYNSMDLIITVDTATVHLAGAMGKKTFCLLGNIFMDPRWESGWYPTVKFLKGRWEESMKEVLAGLQK
jgi:hypothetical protein